MLCIVAQTKDIVVVEHVGIIKLEFDIVFVDIPVYTGTKFVGIVIWTFTENLTHQGHNLSFLLDYKITGLEIITLIGYITVAIGIFKGCTPFVIFYAVVSFCGQ